GNRCGSPLHLSLPGLAVLTPSTIFCRQPGMPTADQQFDLVQHRSGQQRFSQMLRRVRFQNSVLASANQPMEFSPRLAEQLVDVGLAVGHTHALDSGQLLSHLPRLTPPREPTHAPLLLARCTLPPL